MGLFGKKVYRLSGLSQEEQSEMFGVLHDFAHKIPFGVSAVWGISREEAQLALDHAHTDEMTKADVKMAINCMNGYLIWLEQKERVPAERKRELQRILPGIRKKLEAML